MDQNDEFDQSQGNEGENDQFFHQEDQDNVKGDSKSSEILPMPSGFVTKIFVDPNVDPNVNLVKIMLQSNANFTDESETWLYESIFSFYSLLAFEALSMEYQRFLSPPMPKSFQQPQPTNEEILLNKREKKMINLEKTNILLERMLKLHEAGSLEFNNVKKLFEENVYEQIDLMKILNSDC